MQQKTKDFIETKIQELEGSLVPYEEPVQIIGNRDDTVPLEAFPHDPSRSDKAFFIIKLLINLKGCETYRDEIVSGLVETVYGKFLDQNRPYYCIERWRLPQRENPDSIYQDINWAIARISEPNNTSMYQPLRCELQTTLELTLEELRRSNYKTEVPDLLEALHHISPVKSARS